MMNNIKYTYNIYTSTSSTTSCNGYSSYWITSTTINYSTTFNYSDMKNYNYYTTAIFEKDILGLNNLSKTHIPQNVEEKLLDYVSELDKYLIQDMCGCIDSYLQDKCYEIAEKVVTEALREDYCLSANVDKDDIIDEVVNSINFNECYEIINDILDAPVTFEEKLRDVGMSIYDFI